MIVFVNLLWETKRRNCNEENCENKGSWYNRMKYKDETKEDTN